MKVIFKYSVVIQCLIFGLSSSSLTAQERFFSVEESESSRSYDALLWKNFKTDSCTMFDSSNDQETKLRKLGLRRCRDHSISYVQPKSSGAWGWEGKCGQTFGANSLYSLCQLPVEPATFFKDYFRDITPGVKPSTLARGMNKVTKNYLSHCLDQTGNNWKYLNLKNEDRFIQETKRILKKPISHPGKISLNRFGKTYQRSSIGVLVQNPGGAYLHWVSIIDIIDDNNRCEFIVNHWDNQYQVPCTTLASWANNVGRSYPLILKPYSLVTYEL